MRDEFITKNKRYSVHRKFLRSYEVCDFNRNHYLTAKETEKLLNELEEDRQFLEELKIEYKRINNILEEFMNITNRLQANPCDIFAQSMSRDMLIMMGKDVLCKNMGSDGMVKNKQCIHNEIYDKIHKAFVNYYKSNGEMSLSEQLLFEDIQNFIETTVGMCSSDELKCSGGADNDEYVEEDIGF